MRGQNMRKVTRAASDPAPFGGGDGSTHLCKRTASFGAGRQEKGGIKISLKPVSQKAAVPADFEDKMWEKLRTAVTAVYQQQPVEYPMEDLYRAVQDLCASNMGSKLYTRLQATCDAHVAEILTQLESHASTGLQFLEAVSAMWDRFCVEMNTVTTIFNILDREVVLRSEKVPLWEMGVERCRHHFNKRHLVTQKCLSGLVAEVTSEREGNAPNRLLLKNLVGMVSAVQLYDSLEEMLVAKTTAFYAGEAKKASGKDGDIMRYIQLCDRRVTEEADRTEAYLLPRTRRPLIAVAEAQLISEVCVCSTAVVFSLLFFSSHTHGTLAHSPWPTFLRMASRT